MTFSWLQRGQPGDKVVGFTRSLSSESFKPGTHYYFIRSLKCAQQNPSVNFVQGYCREVPNLSWLLEDGCHRTGKACPHGNTTENQCTISVDIFRPLPRRRLGNRYNMVIYNHVTCIVCIPPLKNAEYNNIQMI